MKFSRFLVGTLACTLFAACSNEDVQNSTPTAQTDEAYMTVQFAMAGETTSRALGGFDYADANEVAVTSATFFFLDASYNGCADPYTLNGIDLNPWTPTDHTGETGDDGSIDKTSAPVIVVRNAISMPKYIVAILNPTETYTNRLSLTDLQAINGDYSELTDNGKFVMSSSVYKSNNSEIVAAEVVKDNIKGTEAEALASDAPVVVNVERVLAKVTVNNNDKNGNETIDIDDEEKTVTVELGGFWLDNTNPKSKLIKDIDPTWTGNWWNDDTNHRSYWATSYTPTKEEGYGHGAYSDNNADAKYCQENTDATTHTQVVVAATLKVDNKAVSLVSYRGLYYTKENFLTEIASMTETKKYYVPDGSNGYKNLVAADLDLTCNTKDSPITIGGTPIKDYEAVPTLAESVTEVYTKGEGEAYTKVEDINSVKSTLNNLATVKYWNNGKTYFYFPIEHYSEATSPDNFGKYGVVRNHLYDITISGVIGLGTPVPDEDGGEDPDPIIPETPEGDEQSYIAAKINILSYKVVTNSVTLGGSSSSSETTGGGGE